MLATSTISEVKVFRLKSSKASTSICLKVQKVEAPKALAMHGAKLVIFSPDSKWLLVVRMDDSIHLHRITKETTAKAKLQVSNKTVQLHRGKNFYPILKLKHGTHGDYEKSIVRAAWSSDSRILVVADLSGALDHWILEGHEDLEQGDDEAADQGSTSKSSESEDDEDSDAEGLSEKHPTIIFGQHWIRNPATSALPKLPSPPLILSFRPSNPTSNASPVNGDTAIAVHPTRHNPHPHSHDLPRGEDRLLILTSEHQLLEYQVLKGKLSDWSRRNPSLSLPEPFKVNRDRARDCLWDMSGGRERVWLYGSSWLWMFDLSRDLPGSDDNSDEATANTQIETINKKRKRDHTWTEKRALMKHTTGAGSKIINDELDLGIGNNMRRIVGPDQTDARVFSLELEPVKPTEDEDEDDDDEVDSDDAAGQASALVRLRRGAADLVDANGVNSDSMNFDGEPETNGEEKAARTTFDKGPHYWFTFKYRPILGIVPLAREDEDEERVTGTSGEDCEDSLGVEVALVERPLWDLDLPPRYHGDQEWVK